MEVGLPVGPSVS
jgi:hypothetical protein